MGFCQNDIQHFDIKSVPMPKMWSVSIMQHAQRTHMKDILRMAAAVGRQKLKIEA